MNLLLTAVTVSQPASTLHSGYWIGGVICLLLLAYLVFSLIKPEKF